ncbi:MAG: TetR/AcrR family transcriptional regulator [Saccharospirillum sp.]|nr:TetR/AcrR family transcriptional regulator [Saccharospirillum sp.]
MPKTPNTAIATEKTHYHHGNLNLALIQAARDILEEEGLAKLSLRAAARKVGVSQAAPYHHFKDKEALLASVAAQGHHDFNAAMEKQMNEAGEDPEQRLIACGVAYVTFAVDNPALFRLMFGSTIEHCEQYAELTAAGARSYQTLEAAERAALEKNGEDMSTLPLRALGSWTSVHGLATLIIDGGLDLQQLPSQDVGELTRQVLNARFASPSKN